MAYTADTMLGAIERRLASGKRRAGGGDDIDPLEIVAKMLDQRGLCHFCSQPIGSDFHIDHFNPIAGGGEHSSSNMVLTCPKCNMKKGARTGAVHSVRTKGKTSVHSHKAGRLPMETRYISEPMQVLDPESRTLVGYAAVYNSMSEDLNGFHEVVAPSAFKKSIQEADIRALFNHNPDHVLGRVKAGTLKLDSDERGLKYTVSLPDTQVGRDLYSLVSRGDISQSSFAFEAIRDDWKDDDEVGLVRTLNEVRLFEISAVTFPAYTNTSVEANAVAMRSLARAIDKPVEDVMDAYESGELRQLFKPARQERSEEDLGEPVATPPAEKEPEERDDRGFVIYHIPEGVKHFKRPKQSQ